MLRAMDDMGQPSSYLTLKEGASVRSSDGQPLGEVEYVLADADSDIFDGFVVDTSVLPGGRRFVDASQVAEVYERGVVLNIAAAAAEGLPEPSENPAVMEASAGDDVPGGLESKLRRAWDLISGNY